LYGEIKICIPFNPMIFCCNASRSHRHNDVANRGRTWRKLLTEERHRTSGDLAQWGVKTTKCS